MISATAIKWLSAIGVAIGALLGAYFYGGHVTNLDWQAKYNKDIADATQKYNDALAEQRKKDAAAAQAQSDIEAYYVAKAQNEKADTDKLIADYRSGTVRLRKQLAAYECATAVVRDASAGTSGSNGAGQCGLSSGNVEFLIRFAERANAVRAQLVAAQQVILNDRKLCGATQP